VKKSSIAIEIGLLIRQTRIEKNLSQEDLAFNCELHRTYIGSLERGEKVATILTLEKITKALGISLSDIFKKYEKNQSK
jgi:XRE family transcriptional regulator, regulator of sulfur utilization